MEKYRILVVDDEEIIRQLLVRAFGENDYYVEAVEDAEAALKRIKEDSFNLFIMDLKMPKMMGEDVAAALINDPKTKSIPLVFLTAQVTKNEIGVESIKEIGGHLFIAKPVETERLVSSIKTILGL